MRPGTVAKVVQHGGDSQLTVRRQSLPLDVRLDRPRAAVAETAVPPGDVAVEPGSSHRVGEVRADDATLDREPGPAAFGATAATSGVPVHLRSTGVSLGGHSAECHRATQERQGGGSCDEQLFGTLHSASFR
ncbi:MAG TPA: hypothetical protein VFZ48_03615 [Candidatus Saccharimonadales bacterium]